MKIGPFELTDPIWIGLFTALALIVLMVGKLYPWVSQYIETKKKRGLWDYDPKQFAKMDKTKNEAED